MTGIARMTRVTIAMATMVGALLVSPAIGAADPPGGYPSLQSCEAHLTWTPLQEAHEIINGATIQTSPEQAVPTYKSAGSNPVPDDVWPNYTPPAPYIKNTTRNLQFNESEFIASPSQPCGTQSIVTTSDGYTWGAMSTAINAMWPYDPSQYSGLPAQNAYYAGNLVTTPPPGVVKVTANLKAQNIKFWANENDAPSGTPGAVPLDRYFITDQWGNEYVMHASGQLDQSQVAASFEAAVLPPGWTKSVRHLTKDLILNPAVGADGSFHYLVFRDSADNTYHQVGWSPNGSLEAQVDCGPGTAGHVCDMPIWGGEGNDVLTGDVGGVRNDLMHGAGGNDILRPGYGNDVVWGDAGIDTVVLPGRRSDYNVVSLSADATQLVIFSPAGTKTINSCEFLVFDDGTIPVNALRSPHG
jgi:hypothetical protein